MSRENPLITAGRQAHFADWKRATARHVAGKCAQHCSQPSGVEICVCVCVCVCVCARACVGWVSKNFTEDYEARPMGFSLIHLHGNPMKESSVSSRLHS